eukprot:15461596-Alexandrium_andersonii.AAC.1
MHNRLQRRRPKIRALRRALIRLQQVAHELLRATRARFLLPTRWCPPNDEAQQARLLQVAGVAAQPPFNLTKEVLGHHLLRPVK